MSYDFTKLPGDQHGPANASPPAGSPSGEPWGWWIVGSVVIGLVGLLLARCLWKPVPAQEATPRREAESQEEPWWLIPT